MFATWRSSHRQASWLKGAGDEMVIEWGEAPRVTAKLLDLLERIHQLMPVLGADVLCPLARCRKGRPKSRFRLRIKG